VTKTEVGDFTRRNLYYASLKFTQPAKRKEITKTRLRASGESGLKSRRHSVTRDFEGCVGFPTDRFELPMRDKNEFQQIWVFPQQRSGATTSNRRRQNIS
jgi:hypothetical protein